MAKKLDSFPETARVSQDKYPWGDWLDGSIWELTMGEDFHIKPESFKTGAQQKARDRNGRLRVARPSENVLVIQFIRTAGNDGEGDGKILAPSERADRG